MHILEVSARAKIKRVWLRLSVTAFAFLILSPMALLPSASMAQSPTADTQAPLSPNELNQLLGGPTLVSLHLKNARPEEVFQQLSKQTGIEFRLNPLNAQIWAGKTVSIDSGREPYWLVLGEICRQIPFSISRLGHNTWLEISPGGSLIEQGSPIFQSGSFIFIANQIAREQWFARPLGTSKIPLTKTTRWGVPAELYPYPQVQDGDTVRLTLSALPDPKVHILESSAAFETFPAVADNDEPILPIGREGGSGSIGSFSPATWKLESDLVAYAARTYHSFDFKGMMNLQVITKRETWQIPDILPAREVTKDVTTSRGKVRYILHSVEQDGKLYRVRLTVQYPPFSWENLSAEQQRLTHGLFDQVFSEVRLVDNQGLDLMPRGGGGGGYAEPNPNYSLSFSRRWRDDGKGDTGTPRTLIIEIPVEVRNVAVPVEFKELPIPYFPPVRY